MGICGRQGGTALNAQIKRTHQEDVRVHRAIFNPIKKENLLIFFLDSNVIFCTSGSMVYTVVISLAGCALLP